MCYLYNVPVNLKLSQSERFLFLFFKARAQKKKATSGNPEGRGLLLSKAAATVRKN